MNGSTSAGATCASSRLRSTSRSPGTPTASGSTVPSGWRSLTTTFFNVSPAFQSRSSPSSNSPQVVAGVQEVDERGDRRRVGRVGDACRRHVVVRHRWRHRDAHRLGVRRVVAVGAPDERVLADVERGEELLARRAAHRARHRRDDHVRQAEAVERLDVGGAVHRVRLLQPGVVDVEASTSPSSRTRGRAAARRAGRASSRNLVWIW